MTPRPITAVPAAASIDSIDQTDRAASRPRGPSRPVAVFVAASIVAALAVSGCGHKNDPPAAAGPGAAPGGPPQALPVTVVEAHPTQIPLTTDSVGQSEGSKEVQVRARVSGILQKQRFTEGDRVKAGAVLYTIDPQPYEIALAQARASLQQARATSEQAVREEKRLKPLAAEQAVSGKDYDDATSTVQTAAATVAARQADVRNAELNLSYTQVVAPISGISGRNVNSEGSLVTAGSDSALLTTLTQTDPIWVRFAITENEYTQLRSNNPNNGENAKVEIVLPDGKTYPQAGKLNFAASTVDRTLGTVQLRAEIPNPALRILPGQFVNARLFIGNVDGVLVPQAAVSNSDKGKAVLVVGADNKVEPRPVDAGAWQGSQWVIRSGLHEGDRVITDNLFKLKPGMTVAPHPPQSAAPAGGTAAAGSASGVQPGPRPGAQTAPQPAASMAPSRPTTADASKANGDAK